MVGGISLVSARFAVTYRTPGNHNTQPSQSPPGNPANKLPTLGNGLRFRYLRL